MGAATSRTYGVVRAGAGPATSRVAPGNVVPESGADTQWVRRLRTLAGRRHPTSFPAGQRYPPDAPVFRNRLRTAGACLQLYLSYRPGTGAGAGRFNLRQSMGRHTAFRGRVL